MILTINYLNGEKRIINVNSIFNQEEKAGYKVITIDEKLESIAKSLGKKPLIVQLSDNSSVIATKIFFYDVKQHSDIYIPFEKRRKKQLRQQYRHSDFRLRTNNIRSLASILD